MIRTLGMRSALAALLLIGAAPAIAADKGGCDSSCLNGLATSYMAALVTHDGSKLPWATTVRYAENSVPMMIGDGVWATVTAYDKAPVIVTDAEAGKVIWFGSIDEHGQPGFYAMELTAKDGRILSVQAVMRRKEGRPPFNDPATFTHDPAFAAPQGSTSRSAMTGTIERYLLAQPSNSIVPSFGPGCLLIENGMPMSGLVPAAQGEAGDCTASFKRGLFQEIEGMRYRIAALDEAKGIGVAVGYRDLPAVNETFKTADGATIKAEAIYPRSLGFITLFRIDAGKIIRIESIANELPYLMSAPWKE
jgi:hypothetical protein